MTQERLEQILMEHGILATGFDAAFHALHLTEDVYSVVLDDFQ